MATLPFASSRSPMSVVRWKTVSKTGKTRGPPARPRSAPRGRAGQVESEVARGEMASAQEVDGEDRGDVHRSHQEPDLDHGRPSLVLEEPEDRREARQERKDRELQIPGHDSDGDAEERRGE